MKNDILVRINALTIELGEIKKLISSADFNDEHDTTIEWDESKLPDLVRGQDAAKLLGISSVNAGRELTSRQYVKRKVNAPMYNGKRGNNLTCYIIRDAQKYEAMKPREFYDLYFSLNNNGVSFV